MAQRDLLRPAAARLLRWYGRAARDLPWRRTRDPYAIWVSEVMLQQTQVAKVVPYYTRFLKRFPTRAVLARGSLRDVLRIWEGMGYYARARNLHRAAREMEAERPNAWPGSAEAWQQVPGVGRYTASAIASITLGEAVPVLDGNTRRVLARLDDYAGDARSTRGQNHLLTIAAHRRTAHTPGTINQALRELGARCALRAPAMCLCPCAGVSREHGTGARDRASTGGRVPLWDVAAQWFAAPTRAHRWQPTTSCWAGCGSSRATRRRARLAVCAARAARGAGHPSARPRARHLVHATAISA
jgi:A/G-specific adenine glycosylase